MPRHFKYCFFIHDAEENANTSTEGMEAEKKDDASEAMIYDTAKTESVEAEEDAEEKSKTDAEVVEAQKKDDVSEAMISDTGRDSVEANEVYQGIKAVSQLTLSYVLKYSELLFTCWHSRIDGVGVMLFCHIYFTVLTHPMAHVTFGTEPARLPPTKEELLGCPEHPPAEHAEKLKRLTAEWVNIFPGIGHVSKIWTCPPSHCQSL